MSKRILAILLSLLLVLSVCFTTACKDKSDSSEDGSASSEATNSEASDESSLAELEAKDLLLNSLENLAEDAIPQFPSVEIPEGEIDFSDFEDVKAAAKLDINKLNISGTDYTNGSPLNINADAVIDFDSLGIEANADISYMGENPTASAVTDANGIYITDLLSVYENNLFIPAPIGEALEELKSQYDAEAVIGAQDAVKAVVGVIGAAIDNNIPDEAYTKETKDVVINGMEFKNSTVVSLTVSAETAEKIATEVINGVFEIEFIVKIAEAQGYTAEEAKNSLLEGIDMGEFQSVEINAIIDEEGNIAGAEFIAVFAEDEVLSIRIASANGNLSLKIGLIDDKGEYLPEHEIIYIDYTYDETTKSERLAIGFSEDGVDADLIKIEGTFDGSKHEGVFYLTADDIAISFKYMVEKSDNTLTVNIKDITASYITIPVDLTIIISTDENKVALTVAAKVSMNPFVDIDVALDVKIETTEAEITVPSEFVNAEDLSEEDLAQLVSDVQTKYPNTVALIEQIADLFAPVEDYPMDDDIYYDEDFTFDENYYFDDSLVA